MYSPFTYIRDVFWKTRPIQLTFFVTRRCNAHCPFCFYLRSAKSVQDQPELSLPEITKISASLGSLLWLAFSGGEIFLRSDLVEIAQTFYRNNRPAIMLFPTNGLMPDVILERIERIARSCPKSVIALKLSLDGLGAAHDELRRTPGCFERTMETYGAVAGLLEQYPNFELGVNTVFCSENQDSMEDIIEYVRGLPSVKTHTISIVRGNLADKRYSMVDPHRYEMAIGRLEKNLITGRSPRYRFRGARIKAAQDIVQRRMIETALRNRQRKTACYAGRLNLVLTETGDVFPCEVLSTPFGNVRQYGYDMRRAARSASARHVNKSILLRECSCTHECYWMTNILFNPRMYPLLLREYLRLLL